MSKKNRVQHSTPRRHGDRNVQTHYSGKHQCGDDPIRESSLHNCPGRACGGTCHEADEAVCKDGFGLTLIPEVKVKIRELNTRSSVHMETYNFHSGSMLQSCMGPAVIPRWRLVFEEEGKQWRGRMRTTVAAWSLWTWSCSVRG